MDSSPLTAAMTIDPTVTWRELRLLVQLAGERRRDSDPVRWYTNEHGQAVLTVDL